jgi:hypothetical protein
MVIKVHIVALHSATGARRRVIFTASFKNPSFMTENFRTEKVKILVGFENLGGSKSCHWHAAARSVHIQIMIPLVFAMAGERRYLLLSASPTRTRRGRQ